MPILWNTGIGLEVMQRIAVPTVGGMMSSIVVALIVIPAIYGLIKGWQLLLESARASEEAIESVAVQEAAE